MKTDVGDAVVSAEPRSRGSKDWSEPGAGTFGHVGSAPRTVVRASVARQQFVFIGRAIVVSSDVVGRCERHREHWTTAAPVACSLMSDRSAAAVEEALSRGPGDVCPSSSKPTKTRCPSWAVSDVHHYLDPNGERPVSERHVPDAL